MKTSNNKLPSGSSKSLSSRVEMSEESLKNWKSSIICCGSNAFGQLCSSDSLELMRPLFQTTKIPRIKGQRIDSTMNPSLLSCGANTSIALFQQSPGKSSSNECYQWGEGITSSPSKAPILLSVGHRRINQISCGHSHAGLITEDGRVFTWGQGEHGKLGHGSKQNISNPKQIETLASTIALQISCGAFHSAIIASTSENITYLSTSSLQSRLHRNTVSTPEIDDSQIMKCGKLYMCGLNKAGQLGLGEEQSTSSLSGKYITKNTSRMSMILTPTLVKFFDNEEVVVAQVSCGFHHSLAITTSRYRLESHSSTSVYAFGFGEHGRLGLGDEEQRSYPCKVKLPVGFNSIQVSAGEQHSLARGLDSCYAWGNNTMGQLGAGNPTSMEQALEPTLILMPEAIKVISLVAGSRHSGAVTLCGKVLTWGWGEEGQLGHGSEKNSYLPRPCKLPRHEGVIGIPVDIQLGNTHTTVILRNLDYVELADDEVDVVETDVTFGPEPVKPSPRVDVRELTVEVIIPDPEPDLMPSLPEEDVPIVTATAKSVLLVSDEDTILLTQRPVSVDDRESASIRSFRDLLALRDQREMMNIQKDREEKEVEGDDEEHNSDADALINDDRSDKYGSCQDQGEELINFHDNDTNDMPGYMLPPHPVAIDPNATILPPSPMKHDTMHTDAYSLEPIEVSGVYDTEDDHQPYTSTNSIRQGESSKSRNAAADKVDVFYRLGQNMDNCFVANSAKRAETRKLKMASPQASMVVTAAVNSVPANNAKKTGKSFKV